MRRIFLLIYVAMAAVLFMVSCNAPEPARMEAPVLSGGFASPEAVVRSFCDFDAGGKRLPGSVSEEETSYYRGLVHWTEEPEWDNIVIITGYKIGATRQSADGVDVPVTYSVRGKYAAALASFYKAEEKIHFKVVKTPSGWRIQGPPVNPHMYPSKLIASLKRRVKNEHDPRGKNKLQKDINLIKNMKCFAI